MKTIQQNDFAAFLAKLHTGPYERKNDELATSLEKIAVGFEAFKKTHGDTVATLQNSVQKMETRMARPGAFTAERQTLVPDDRVRLFDEKTGKPALVLKAGDDIHARYREHSGIHEHDDDVSLSDFMRGVAGMKTRSELVRKSLSAGTDTAGGFALPNVVFQDLLSGLAAESTVLQAGGLVVPLGSEGDGAKNYSYAAINAIPTASWRSETGAVSPSEPTFRRVLITPQSIAFYFKASRELLMDGGNIDSVLRLAAAQAFAKELDRAALLGTGTAPQPRGLVNVAGVQSVTNGANGASLATLRYGNLFSGALAIRNADAPMPGAAIMSHRSRFGLGQLVDTTNQPLEVPPMLREIKLLSTSQVPDNVTVGSSTDCSSMFLGKFEWMGYAIRENVNVQLLHELFAATGEVGFLCHARVDVMCLYPQAFSVVTGIRP